MNLLKDYLNSLVPFTEFEMEAMMHLFTKRRLSKNEYFAKEGEYSSQLAFLVSGVMRAFFRGQDGHEYNKTFFTTGHFVGAYSSLVTQKQNLINIQCLTEVDFWVVDYNALTSLYMEYPKIERFARIIAERKFVVKEKREIELVTLGATERYAIFRKEHPSLENLIPQYHIASYLGVTPTQLSRIRAQK